MWEKIDDLTFLVIGVLLVLFRKECAKFVIWYHRRRWYHREHTKDKQKEYPDEAWSAGNYFVQIFVLIMGIIVVVLSLLSLFEILKVKP